MEALAAFSRLVITPRYNGEKTATQKAVLNALAYLHGPQGCWPAKTRIAEHTGLDRRTVQRTLKELQEKGHICPAGKHSSGTTRWTLHPDPNGPAVDDRNAAEYLDRLRNTPPKGGRQSASPPLKGGRQSASGGEAA